MRMETVACVTLSRAAALVKLRSCAMRSKVRIWSRSIWARCAIARVESNRQSAVSRRQPRGAPFFAADCRLPAADCRLPVADCQCRLPPLQKEGEDDLSRGRQALRHNGI